jgi:Ca2+-transporting ATPase
MQRPPRDVNTALFAGRTLLLALLQGLGALAVVLGATLWGAGNLTEGAARAFSFSTLVCTNLALIFSNRSRSTSLWASLWVPNRTLWAVVGAALGLMSLALYQPWLAGLFKFDQLRPVALAGALGLGLLSMVWFEWVKSRAAGASDVPSQG